MAASASSRRACPASLLFRASNRRPGASKIAPQRRPHGEPHPFATLNQIAAAWRKHQIE